MNLTDRIDAHESEGEALDTLLSPVLDKLLAAYGENPPHWYLLEFDTDGRGNIRLTAFDDRDADRKQYSIPADIVETNTVDAYCAKVKDDIEEKKRAAARADKARELERLEARTRILRGELSGG